MDEKEKVQGSRVGDRRKPTKRAMGSRRVIFWRTAFLMVLCGILMFVPLIQNLWTISIVKHDEYSKLATNQQTRDVAVSAERGDITDRNGEVLAMSSTVYKLILSPLDVIAKVPEMKYKKDGVLDEEAYNAAIEARREMLIDGISEIAGLDREMLETRMLKTNSQYEIIKTNIEQVEAEKLREFMSENNCGYDLYLTPDAKRYYPYASLASHVIGFVNSEGGAYGIEALYEDSLEGTQGRIVTTKTGLGIAMHDSYSEYVDAQNGYDVQLTIDATIQSYAEKTLAEGIEAYDIQCGGFCIVMNPQTAEVLALASTPGYDLNSYGTVQDSQLLLEMDSMAQSYYTQYKADPAYSDKTDDEIMSAAQNQAYSDALNSQWRNQAVNDVYDPGSTFKAMVLAAALEENVITENSTFYCPGYYMVNGQRINCSKVEGHKDQTLAEAVQNSCNPAFMEIGQALGAEKFYDYFEAFGLKEQTGIELAGEASGLIWSREYLCSPEGYLSLATASFGQRFQITPLQNITAFAAVINGGYLLTPHIVDEVTTEDGIVVDSSGVDVVRQVVSEDTSAICREILESVVSEGTGGKAYVPGYSIGGKTGTSETLVPGEVVVSFMGFAPADDPEVLVLLGYNKPEREYEGSNYSATLKVYVSGGNMAAPMAGQLISEILDYLNVPKSYTPEEAARADVRVPNVRGVAVDVAANTLKIYDLAYRTVGEGDVVTAQIPAQGSSIPGGSTVILYLGDETPPETGIVPNLDGMDYDKTKQTLEAAGFFMRVVGSNQSYGTATLVESQSIPAGTETELGTVVEVNFLSADLFDGFIYQ